MIFSTLTLRFISISTFRIITLVFLYYLTSCTYDHQEVDKSEENFNVPVDFSPIYVIGDKHSSGFMDGALYEDGQVHSYPALLSKKLATTLERYDHNSIRQALVENENGFNLEIFELLGETQGKYYLRYPHSGSLHPRRYTEKGVELNNWNGDADSLSDFSLPSLKVYQINSLPALEENIYYRRLGIDQSPLELLIEADPGAIILDIGSEDLLQYALHGASGSDTVDIGSIEDNDLISASDFDSILNDIINMILNQTNAHVFIASLSNPLSAPYFRTIERTMEPEIYSMNYLSSLGQYYQDFNDDVFQYNHIENDGLPNEEQRPLIDFDPTGYPDNISPRFKSRVIEDEYLDYAELEDGTVIPKWRQMVENELVLYENEPNLNESSQLSGEIALSDEQVLTIKEIEIINDRVSYFNQTIENIAENENRVSLINVRQIIQEISNSEYSLEGVIYSNKFDRYGIYSADGYSLNPRGNAIITNELIKTINLTFGTSLNHINPNEYRGTEFIFSQ